MHRFFGKPKPKVEGPSLEDTSKGISGRITDCKFIIIIIIFILISFSSLLSFIQST